MDDVDSYQDEFRYNTSGLLNDYQNFTIETQTIPPVDFHTLSLLIIGVFLSLLIFLSIAGNILVCAAIYTDRGLRRIGNLFLASLAIADLFVAALVMSFALVNDLLGYWMFGSQFCDTWIAFDVMCSTSSILNLCAISLDRYIHIKDPLRYSRWVTRRIALFTIACIWLLAALISFVPISLGLHRPRVPVQLYDGELPTCALDLTPTYAVVSSCISFYVPCIVMLGIYLRLYCYAQKHVKSIRAVTRPLPSSSSHPYPSPTVHHITTTSSPYHVSDHKAAITVGVIMGTFLLCWVPFFCVNIIAAFCKTCIPGYWFKILTWLGYSNSSFNPIIYSIYNKEFRDAFKRILITNYTSTAYTCCLCYVCCRRDATDFGSDFRDYRVPSGDYVTRSKGGLNNNCSEYVVQVDTIGGDMGERMGGRHNSSNTVETQQI
uniref:Dopamine receptor 1 n=1 Tax=Cacopsylla melanoneura TaxID=428564 RepID=A0A8D8QR96_9HEMI